MAAFCRAARFVGYVNASVQGESFPLRARVANLMQRWNVHMTSHEFGDDYRRLLGRARIVFNRSIRREANLRAFETIAAGALLFQEAENREFRDILREGEEFIAYNDTNLEERLDYFLAQEDERRAITERARQRRQELTFE